MSQLAAFRALQQEINLLEEKKQKLKESGSLAKELEFEEKLKALMEEFAMSKSQVIGIINPGEAGNSSGGRRARAVKVYKHPETGDVIETKGGNHKGLKAWKTEHGADVVETWLV